MRRATLQRGTRCLTWLSALAVCGLDAAAMAQEEGVLPIIPPPPVRPVGTSEVKVSEFMTVDVVAQNDYVTNVLQKLAIQARRNIVPSAHVERLVTANIYGVPFYDALNGLLQPNGLGYVEEGEFIFVYSAEEMEEKQVGGFGAVSKVLHLDYLRAEDAQTYVASLLSANGSTEISRDLGEEGGEAAAAVPGSVGGAVTDTNDIYTPEEDEYDLRNSLIVHDLPERIERVEAFLKEIDTRPAQVLIEASIIQTSITEDNAFGIDFAILGEEAFTDFFQAPVGENPVGFLEEFDPVTGLTSPVVPATNDAFALSTPGNTGVGEATIRAGFTGNIGVFLRALDQVTDVTLLSNPKVTTLNRQRTKVFVGTRVGYFETTTAENIVNQTIKYLDTGIVLDVRPFVLKDGRIRLELSPKISQVSFRNVTAPNGTTQQIPDEQIQTVTTDVLVPDGYTAVLGGLFREDTERQRNQIPVLGDLPLLGSLFQGRDESLRQTEVVFLIKPTVVQDEQLTALGADGDEWAQGVRVGSRYGLLPWSRERQSARLNLEAERLLSEGEVKKARHRLRSSLGMFPQQAGVVRALERLDREDLWIRDLSYLNRMVDEEYARMEREEALNGSVDSSSEKSGTEDGE